MEHSSIGKCVVKHKQQSLLSLQTLSTSNFPSFKKAPNKGALFTISGSLTFSIPEPTSRGALLSTLVNSRHYVANFQQKGSSAATTLFRPLKVIEPNKGWASAVVLLIAGSQAKS